MFAKMLNIRGCRTAGVLNKIRHQSDNEIFMLPSLPAINHTQYALEQLTVYNLLVLGLIPWSPCPPSN